MYADHDLTSCTSVTTAIKMPEDSEFTPRSGLLTPNYEEHNVVRFEVSDSFFFPNPVTFQ